MQAARRGLARPPTIQSSQHSRFWLHADYVLPTRANSDPVTTSDLSFLGGLPRQAWNTSTESGPAEQDWPIGWRNTSMGSEMEGRRIWTGQGNGVAALHRPILAPPGALRRGPKVPGAAQSSETGTLTVSGLCVTQTPPGRTRLQPIAKPAPCRTRAVIGVSARLSVTSGAQSRQYRSRRSGRRQVLVSPSSSMRGGSTPAWPRRSSRRSRSAYW